MINLKDKPILRWLLLGVLFGVMYLLGFIFYWPSYTFRSFIRKNKHIWVVRFFWFFLNDGESSDYGAEWWLIREGYDLNESNVFKRFIIISRWNIIRNSHYNLKLAIKPNVGEINWIKIVGRTGYYNYDNLGSQFCLYEIGGAIYFRSSATWEMLGRRFNYQIGTSEIRYIYKFRNRNIN